MNKQTEALRLADALDADATNGDMGRKPDPKCHKRQAAAELRRLHQALAKQPAQQQEPVRSISDEQDAFEKVFKLPEGITRFDGGYAPTSYSAWSAQQQCYRWEGWKARAMIAAPQPAQPQQEPLGYMNAGHVHEMQQGRLPYGYVYPKGGTGAGVAVYTSPPARKPLTDEQIAAIGKELGLRCRLGGNPNIDFDYARAIEAAHGIKESK